MLTQRRIGVGPGRRGAVRGREAPMARKRDDPRMRPCRRRRQDDIDSSQAAAKHGDFPRRVLEMRHLPRIGQVAAAGNCFVGNLGDRYRWQRANSEHDAVDIDACAFVGSDTVAALSTPIDRDGLARVHLQAHSAARLQLREGCLDIVAERRARQEIAR
jgi:hypothetical protein